MKKLIILTAAASLLAGLLAGGAAPARAEGSVNSGTAAAAGSAVTKTAVTGTPVLSHAEAVYQAVLPLLSSGRLSQAIAYINANMYAVSPYQASVLTLRLENLHKALLPAWESKFSSSEVQRKLNSVYKAGVSMAKLADSTDNAALRTLLRSAGESGYKLETAEGAFFPVIDYAAYRKYKLYVTGDIRDYITIMATESDLPPSKDNGLIIAWGDVAARTLTQEQFIQDYPKSNRLAAVKTLYTLYTANTFYGQNNTPLFHYDNLEMDLEAQKAYSSILAKNTDSSPFLEKLDGFMKLMKSNGYLLDDTVKQYLKTEVPLS
ncbi:hypothetical protein [Paenibacillus sp. MMS20-IR301]|uniref:hypothetical protein n=1 Tax=Paenibacillus sp. MMS20-IR301 TaxID=2895946 RepID=UPI0028F09057|nr:hypothetical protein [Paenibacillus sp. MMS20-IR301]WNS41602.1 hypothetical protein LOS79_21575 [Paenibacillus sp. MMS20-IR301]